MTPPYLSSNRRQPRIGYCRRNRVLHWKPRLSERPASALEARLADAFRLLDPRSAPLVSMLYAGSRPSRRIRATRAAGRARS